VSETQLIAINGTENENRIADVIFVHGLGGDALSTWHPQEKKEINNSWLAWLGRDFENIGIWSVDYEVEPFRWRGSTMPLADRATNVVDLLDIYEIGERPVIFITHSMGGLVVKQMLRHAYDYGNPSWKKIVEQTKGIVFLSTPHSGSDIANWMKYIGGIFGASVSVEELRANAPRLRELNTVYRNHLQLKEIPIIVYCENEKTNGVMVVDQTSADPGIPGVTPIPLDDNHISIAKPRSDKSQLYLRVKKFIKERLSNPQPLPYPHSKDKIPLLEAIEEDNNRESEFKKKR
jgi:pimeloyl-ACP methyl ester carboxylesterase